MTPEYDVVWNGAKWREGYDPADLARGVQVDDSGSLRAFQRRCEDEILEALEGAYYPRSELREILGVYSKTAIFGALKRLQARKLVICKQARTRVRVMTVFGLADRPWAYVSPRQDFKVCSSCREKPRNKKSAFCKDCRREYDRNRREAKLAAA